MKWIFFSYSLPAEPSRVRVYVWRQLKKLGAICHQSVWVVPHAKERLNSLNRLVEEIEGWNGAALLITGTIVVKAQEQEIIRAFTDSRNEEYREIIQKCEEFLKEIQFEIGRENFIFAEVEENEEELEKLKHWLKKVEKRDVIKPPLRKTTLERIKQCESIFNDFARRVYEHQKARA
ncbi:MAG: chromate resistance protein ChrB [Deltaproteobacteria bacterium]|nr:chromate resistance protein ChrB [Deltaproteobacteria bacterium]